MSHGPANKHLSYRTSHKMVLPVDQLKPGMYVAALDRPWEETPFLFQGFVLQDQQEIEEIGKYCCSVTIDIQSSVEFSVERHSTGSRSIHRKRVSKPDNARRNIARADDTFRHTHALVRNIMDDVRLGKAIDTPAAKEAVAECVNDVLERPDAMMLLTRIRQKDEYTSQHSLSVSVLSISLGRKIGLPREKLQEVGLSALLHDVGKVLTPDEVLNKPGRLNEEEMAVMRRHPSDGRDIILSSDGIVGGALDVAHAHHEKLNGSGYPRGLNASQMTHYTKMVAITDTFDAITSDRVYKNGRTNMFAFKILTNGRKKFWDNDLVFQFIDSVGIYPPGSIVVLSTGETAVVIESHPKMKLRPKVMVLNNLENPGAEMHLLDLAKVNQDQQGQRLYIVDAVHPNESGIDMRALIDLGILGNTDTR